MAFEAELRVDTGLVKAKGKEIAADIREMTTFLSSVENEVSETGSYWEGHAGTEERKNFLDLVEECKKLITQFGTYPVKILEMAGEYENAETDNRVTVKKIEADIKLVM